MLFLHMAKKATSFQRYPSTGQRIEGLSSRPSSLALAFALPSLSGAKVSRRILCSNLKRSAMNRTWINPTIANANLAAALIKARDRYCHSAFCTRGQSFEPSLLSLTLFPTLFTFLSCHCLSFLLELFPRCLAHACHNYLIVIDGNRPLGRSRKGEQIDS